MWLWVNWHCKLVHTCMVYTELAPRWQQCHMAPAMQQANSVASTPLLWILKHYKRIQSFIQNHMRHERAESARKQRITLYKWSITHRHTHTHKHTLTTHTYTHTHLTLTQTNTHLCACMSDCRVMKAMPMGSLYAISLSSSHALISSASSSM